MTIYILYNGRSVNMHLDIYIYISSDRSACSYWTNRAHMDYVCLISVARLVLSELLSLNKSDMHQIILVLSVGRSDLILFQWDKIATLDRIFDLTSYMNELNPGPVQKKIR